MALRNFFEGLGEFFDWTFQILPWVGNNFNYLIMAVMTGYAIYWFGQMVKHSRAGER